MGFWGTFGREMRGIFMLPETAKFAAEEPYQPIAQLLYSMTHGGSAAKVSRVEALSVPSVLRGRNMICNISTLPLGAIDENRKPVFSPFLNQIDPDVPNVVTLANTLEDLFFEGISYWLKTEEDLEGNVLRARHIAWESVTLQRPANGRSPSPLPSGIDPRETIPYVDGRPVSWRELITFHSPNPGLLKAAARPIRRAIQLDKVANMYADNPRPLDYLTPKEGALALSPAEVAQLLIDWQGMRNKFGTAWLDGAEYHEVNAPTPSDMQIVEQQVQVDRQLSNAMGIDAVDVGVSTTSNTYQNSVDRRMDKVNTVLAGYMLAITQRLSLDDVTRPGERVVFDLDDFLRADPKTRAEVADIRIQNGTKTVEEDRKDENMPDLPAGQRPAAPALEAPAVPQTVGASRWVSVQLDSDESLTFADVPLATFAVNAEARTITGLAVPFNKIALNQGRRWRFAEGSLEFAELGRVKLLRDHDRAQAVGRAVELTQTADGYVVKFSVARGLAGDAVLALAEDGVLDGLSIGVDIADAVPDPNNRGALLVRRAILREVSLTAMPAFDDSRLTSVQATRDEGNTMSDDATPEPQAPAAPASVPDLNAFFTAWQAQNAAVAPQPEPQPQARPVINPTRSLDLVAEPVPYRFDRGGNFVETDHVFSADLLEMSRSNDQYGDRTEAGKRVMGLIQAAFADTRTTDVADLNPTIQRPDMYVDQRDYRTPLWNAINKGSLPNGVQPFRFPKFSAASGLVGDHTEGTEPSSGSFDATGQTVTPTALSGKASVTREVWDMGGSPQVSTLIFNQMLRSWREGLENATATFLNTLTAATDINLGVAPTDAAFITSWESALVDLQFIRGYDFDFMAAEQWLYKKFASAKYISGEPAYPMINPMNRNGTSERRFVTLDAGGVVVIPTWALTAVSGSANNSWLLDSTTVHGWATAPQRLEFPGTKPTDGTYAPVAWIDIAIWGYKAFANSDIGGVRQVIFDNA